MNEVTTGGAPGVKEAATSPRKASWGFQISPLDTPYETEVARVADQPLNDDEELVWRSLMRLVFTLRPALDADLQRSCGISSTEYSALMHLSESPDRQLRMSELADRMSLSPSRISRVIDVMVRDGLVERRPGSGSGDGRNTFAGLTRTGLATLRRAWPHHLRSVRQRAFDHLTPEETSALGPLLQRLAEAGESLRSPMLDSSAIRQERP